MMESRVKGGALCHKQSEQLAVWNPDAGLLSSQFWKSRTLSMARDVDTSLQELFCGVNDYPG